MNTAFSFLGILVLAGLVVGGQTQIDPCLRHFLGTWQHRQGADDGFDAEGERLELGCAEGAPAGLYYALEREGDHGLFYTLTEVRDLRVDQAGLISFVVPERELFQPRPSTLTAMRQRTLPSSGFTRDQLFFQGRVEAGNLVLSCTSRANSSPEPRMVFHR
jgi:hypothetical protein